jgi:hypothetical protein
MGSMDRKTITAEAIANQMVVRPRVNTSTTAKITVRATQTQRMETKPKSNSIYAIYALFKQLSSVCLQIILRQKAGNSD